MSQPQTTAESSRPPLPRLWARFSIPAGSAIQLAGIAAGGALLIAAAHAGKAAAIMLMAAGFLAVYLCSHAIAHVAVGRAVGIRFRAYGVRGTDHPEMYPPGVRQVMSALPMWTALTEKNSMRSASRPARAAMFAAGETSTSVFSLAAAGYAAHAGIPGGRALLVGTILWTIASTITVAIVPKGDYAKALRALGWRKPLSSYPAPPRADAAGTDLGPGPPGAPRNGTAERHRRLEPGKRPPGRAVGPRRRRIPLVPVRHGPLGAGRRELGPPGAPRSCRSPGLRPVNQHRTIHAGPQGVVPWVPARAGPASPAGQPGWTRPSPRSPACSDRPGALTEPGRQPIAPGVPGTLSRLNGIACT